MIMEDSMLTGEYELIGLCRLEEISKIINQNIKDEHCIDTLRILRIKGGDKYQIYLKEKKEENK